MSVPVGKRSVVDREHYLDATQRYVLAFHIFFFVEWTIDWLYRGLSKAANASTFGGSPHIPSSTPTSTSATATAAAARDDNGVAHVEESEHRHHRLHLFKRHMD